ncbi:MAG: 2-oxoacid:acceptor oxidoreductase family protein [Elusimicrobia bacterium]|nr:2-oxoacid:acceptor oxidoreductase family protein [Elusimicrobiota bacterium]
MGRLTEIRWHGRGGQGAKTAALLFADAALGEGLYIQAFPEYGPERMGAPVQSFDRLSDEPITIHCGVTNPSVVIVLDPTLIGTVDVTQGLPADGAIIINTSETAKDIRQKLGITKGKVYTVDASLISKETIGRDIPNTPLLGALAKVTGLINFERMVEDNRKKLTLKFKNRPEIIEGNIKSIQRAYQEVKGEE